VGKTTEVKAATGVSPTSISDEEFFVPGETDAEERAVDLLVTSPTTVEAILKLTRDLDAAEEEYSVASKLKQEAEKKKKALEQRLWSELQELSLPSIDRGDYKFGRSERLWMSVEDEEKLLKSLDDEGLLQEMTGVKFESGRINAMIKERLEKQEPLPEGLGFAVTRVISRTKSGPRKQYAKSNDQYKGEANDGEAFEIG